MDRDKNNTILEELLQSANEWSLSKLFLCVFLCLVCLTTVFGNGVVLYVFFKSKRALRSPCHILLANLATADFLVGAMVMPILISVTVFDFKWYWGDLMCQLQDYVHFCLCATSMLSMVAVCLERFVGVKYPMHHKRILTKKRVVGISGVIWIMALVLTATPLSLWPIKGERSPFTCGPNLRHDFVFFISLSLYWLPIGMIVYIYWLIYKTSTIPSAELMQWAKKSLGSTVVSTVSAASSRRRSSKAEEEKFAKAREKQARVLKKMTKLILGMLIFYGPLFLLFFLRGLKVSWFSIDLLLAFAWLRYFSSCSNTFLYIHVMPYYKQQLLRLLCNSGGSSRNNDKSEATSTAMNRENDSSSYSYSSSVEGGTGKTVVNSVPSLLSSSLSSSNLKSFRNCNNIERESTHNAPIKATSSANPSDINRNMIQEMEDIVTKIDSDIKILCH